MSRKWELHQPEILKYLDEHPGCYLCDMVEDLQISAYVITTALQKAGRFLEIQQGLSPKKKEIRDKKLSQVISEMYATGKINKCSYDESWKAKVKAGQASFRADPEAQRLASEKRDATCKATYGEDYKEQFSKKCRETKLKRYGNPYYCNPEKAKATKLRLYGDENYNNREQAEITNQERYGGTGNASPELLAKFEATCTRKFGHRTNLLSEDPEVNGEAGKLKRFGSKEAMYEHALAKGQQTRLEKYGDAFYSNHEQASQTMIEKYGVKYFCEHPKCREALVQPEVIEKRYETMRNNDSFNKSKPEESYYKYLLTQYEETDIIRQYKDSTRYPFNCDFYIISEDKFIECNYHWTHGPHPFDPNNLEDVQLLQSWQTKAADSNFYATAIHVWTNLDVRKMQIAKQNNLNIEFLYSE